VGFVLNWLAAAVRRCGCRWRAARRATPERLPGRRGPARALLSRRVGHGPAGAAPSLGRPRGAGSRAISLSDPQSFRKDREMALGRRQPDSRQGTVARPRCLRRTSAREGVHRSLTEGVHHSPSAWLGELCHAGWRLQAHREGRRSVGRPRRPPSYGWGSSLRKGSGTCFHSSALLTGPEKTSFPDGSLMVTVRLPLLSVIVIVPWSVAITVDACITTVP
jgi:hypothetical protein